MVGGGAMLDQHRHPGEQGVRGALIERAHDSAISKLRMPHDAQGERCMLAHSVAPRTTRAVAPHLRLGDVLPPCPSPPFHCPCPTVTKKTLSTMILYTVC